MHDIARLIAEDSADRHRVYVNRGATLPDYSIGSQVLLYDPTTKKGECGKLKVRYTGPYLITARTQGGNYKLQLVAAGKDVKRAVHPRRLRPFVERDNCPQGESIVNDWRYTYEGRVNETLRIKIAVRDVVDARTELVLCQIDDQFKPIVESSRRLIKKGRTAV